MGNFELPLKYHYTAEPGIEKAEIWIPIYMTNKQSEYNAAAIIHKLSHDMTYKTKLIWTDDHMLQKTILTKNDKIIHSDEYEVGYSKRDLFNTHCSFKNNDKSIPPYMFDVVYEDVLHNIECRRKAIEKDPANNVNYWAVYPNTYDKFFKTLEDRIFLLGYLLGKLKKDGYDCYISGYGANRLFTDESYIHIKL